MWMNWSYTEQYFCYSRIYSQSTAARDRSEVHIPKTQKNAELTDFEFIRAIGRGSYGIVHQAKHIASGKYYAIKVISKKLIFDKKNIHKVVNEKSILSAVRFEFLAHLEYFFQDNSNIYFVVPYCPGGDLFIQLRIYKKFQEPVARFYTAQITLALEYLHSIDLIHRDIKPENVVINFDGYIKLTDFGFCKKLLARTYTFCGTAEYIAPEILSGRGYGKSADWWSVGIMLFELVFGYTPFRKKNRSAMFESIKSGRFDMPNQLYSSDFSDLVHALIRTDTTRRVGCLKRGPSDIKDHRFFHSINWKDLYLKKIVPPFKPPLKSHSDSFYFKKIREGPEFFCAQNEFGDYFNVLND